MVLHKNRPAIKHTMASPIKIVIALYKNTGMRNVSQFIIVIEIPTATELNNTGKTAESTGKFFILIFLQYLVNKAEINVANVPNITSIKPKGLEKFDNKHPIVSPGIEAGEITGRIVKASESLNCIPENEIG